MTAIGQHAVRKLLDALAFAIYGRDRWVEVVYVVDELLAVLERTPREMDFGSTSPRHGAALVRLVAFELPTAGPRIVVRGSDSRRRFDWLERRERWRSAAAGGHDGQHDRGAVRPPEAQCGRHFIWRWPVHGPLRIGH